MSRAFVGAVRLSLRELQVMYPARLYLVGWLPHILAQLAFFGLLTQNAGGSEAFRYAVIGNAVFLGAQTCLSYVTYSVTMERYLGTLPLAAASPTTPLLAIAGRNVGMFLHGYSTGLLSLGVAAVAAGVRGPTELVAAALLLLTCIWSAYSVGLLVGVIALRGRGMHNILANVALLLTLAAAGVNVPVAALPDWLATLAQVLPVTHGLAAVRGALDGDPALAVLRSALLEVAVGTGYVLVALASFRKLLQQSKRDGFLSLS